VVTQVADPTEVDQAVAMEIARVIGLTITKRNPEVVRAVGMVVTKVAQAIAVRDLEVV
jgi:hypothetical protein